MMLRLRPLPALCPELAALACPRTWQGPLGLLLHKVKALPSAYAVACAVVILRIHMRIQVISMRVVFLGS